MNQPSRSSAPSSSGARRRWLAPVLGLVVVGSLLLAIKGCDGAAQPAGNGGAKPRVIVLGFDGVDHGLATKFIADGALPNLQKLAAGGTFSRLETTNPAESAVSWSTFGRGLNPGKSNMFGFVSRKKGTYFPEPRFMRLDKKPFADLYKDSDVPPGVKPPKELQVLGEVAEGKPLWHRLDEAKVRVKGFLVPMATPIDPFRNGGRMSGGLGVPDVRGSAIGSYFIFSTSREDVGGGDSRSTASASKVFLLKKRGDAWVSKLPGPKKGRFNTESKIPVRVTRAGADRVSVTVGKADPIELGAGDWSDFISGRFGLDWPMDARAVTRFRVVSTTPEIKLFFAPLSYHPEDIPPHMLIEQPPGFSGTMSKDAGQMYDTTGWPCITNPLKDLEIDEGVFLEHIKKLTDERSKVVFSELAKDDWDFYFTMFGETDRVSHMMYRAIDPKHPMYDAEVAKKHGSAILDSYKRMDRIVGEVMKHLDERTYLFVVSDHGFTSFRRQVSLNTWLIQEGYLVAKGGRKDTKELARTLRSPNNDFLLYMDPSKSRAFALGLGKIYINDKKEKSGIVEAKDVDALCEEIMGKLLELKDPADGAKVVSKVWRDKTLYSGSHVGEDAEINVGFAEFYRISWSTTTGGFSPEVIEDNDNVWSGDHATNDPDVVPGVLFTSKPIEAGQKPGVIDMASTILALFGLPSGDLDGKIVKFK